MLLIYSYLATVTVAILATFAWVSRGIRAEMALFGESHQSTSRGAGRLAA